MKTPIFSLVASLLLISFSAFSQEKTVFENASLSKNANNATVVTLNWKKGAENTNYYLVERSADGNEFKTIALVFTSEKADFVNYQYNDKASASNSAAYYRITIVNDRKELTYLPVQKVDFASGITTSIFAGDATKDVASK